ncbi:MAG: hypothetical protein ACPLPW_08670, partial [bacterium]
CGLAGGFLTLSLGAFVPNVTAGRGWIALVVIYLGNRTPGGLLIGSLIFGLVEYLSNYLQASSNIPSGLLLALPFFVTVIAMIVYSILENRFRFRIRSKMLPLTSSSQSSELVSQNEKSAREEKKS